jgi:hypothetical protein
MEKKFLLQYCGGLGELDVFLVRIKDGGFGEVKYLGRRKQWQKSYKKDEK